MLHWLRSERAHGRLAPLARSALLYGLSLAVAAFALRWLEYRYTVRTSSPEIYIALVAAGFAGLGAWAGNRLTRRAAPPAFRRNTEALAYLNISEREYEVLVLLAEGHSNREIAERLFVSPNTVKTHLANLYDKLDVARRTQAVSKAKQLRLVP